MPKEIDSQFLSELNSLLTNHRRLAYVVIVYVAIRWLITIRNILKSTFWPDLPYKHNKTITEKIDSILTILKKNDE